MPECAKLWEFALHYAAAWCSQDAASVAAHYSPDGSLHINDGAPATGRSAITEVGQGFMTRFQLFRYSWTTSSFRATVLYTTGHSSAPTLGRAGPGSGFASAASRYGRLEMMGFLPSRRATSIGRLQTSA